MTYLLLPLVALRLLGTAFGLGFAAAVGPSPKRLTDRHIEGHRRTRLLHVNPLLILNIIS